MFNPNNIPTPKCKKQAPTNITGDHYDWLTNRGNPEVINYLKEENSYAELVMQNTKKLQQELFDEIKSRIKEDDITAPWEHDQYLYYFKTKTDQEYSIFCRRFINTLEDTEQILLDENELAKNFEFFETGDMEISPCHQYLAYTVDTTGNESYQLYVKDLKNSQTYCLIATKDKIKISDEIVWSADSKSILYIKLNRAHRNYQVWHYNFAAFIENNNTQSLTFHTQIFHEKDERFELSIERTRSDQYLLIASNSQISSEIYYFPADNLISLDFNTVKFIKSIKTRAQDVKYYAEHCNDYFYISINSKEKLNFELYRFHISDSDNWELLIAHQPDIQIEHLDCFANFAILFTKQYGLPQLKIINNYDFKNIINFDIPQIFNEQIYDVAPGHNQMFNTSKYIFDYDSLITPSSTYSIEPQTKINPENFNLQLIKSDEVLNGYDKNHYLTQRLLIDIGIDPDTNANLKLPISILYNKNQYKPDGNHPLLLYGYGAYGISIDPYFSYSRVSLLDRGIAFAIAHVRGGGELGESWHHGGRLACKNNTFNDFITAAEYLINNKYTHNSKLIIEGRSAGGLLIGNVINQRPELFHIAIAQVPFVDCLNTMLNPELPLTIGEYEEWGNPSNNKEAYEYIKSYAPYENIKQQKYPHLLLNNSINDYRVNYWEAAKFAAKLRAHKLDQNLLLLKTLMNAGHGGSSGRYQALHETVFNYSFILLCLGL